MNQYEHDCNWQSLYAAKTIDIGHIVAESNMTYEVFFLLLKEFAKAGYNAVTTDIEISGNPEARVPWAMAGIVLTKEDI